jgi:hypothetical protein
MKRHPVMDAFLFFIQNMGKSTNDLEKNAYICSRLLKGKSNN